LVEGPAYAAIDIGEIVLASKERSVPRTGGRILADLETVASFVSLSESVAPDPGRPILSNRVGV
jgi:hypothetical protein